MMSKEKVTFSAEELLSVMNEGRVDKAVIFGAGPYLFPQFNKMIAETVNKYPDRLIGFARVDPYEGEKAVEEDRAPQDPGGRESSHKRDESSKDTTTEVEPILFSSTQICKIQTIDLLCLIAYV